MLDRLPNELLQHILRLAVPLEYTPSKYRERRELLRRCCLVDKRMKEVAQPMLTEVFVVRSKEDSKLLEVKLNVGRKRGELVKLLLVEGRYSYPGAATAEVEFPTLIRLTPAVVDLRAKYGKPFDLDRLNGLQNIQRAFFSSSLRSSLLRQPLPHLVELTLYETNLSSISAAAFTPTNLPNLRALSAITRDYFLSSLPRELFAQLDVYSTDLFDSVLEELSSLATDGYDTRTVLLDTNPEDLVEYLPSPRLDLHLRLIVTEGEEEILAGQAEAPPHFYLEESLFAVATKMRTSSKPLHLKLFILPSALHPSRVQHLSTVPALDTFLAACQAKSVEVIWEEQPDWDCEHWTSPAFWERSRRARIESEKAGTS